MRVIGISLGIYAVLLVGLQLGWGIRLPYVPAVLGYVLISAAVSVIDRRRAVVRGVVPDVRLPTSGPIGRTGQVGLIAAFTLSGLVALLNPWQARQMVRQTTGNARAKRRLARARAAAEAGPDGDPTALPRRARYTLPFDGEWLVYNGGPDPATSHSWDVIAQRFAFDFVRADDAGRRHTGRGTRLDEYFAWGEPIRAAAPGEVVRVVDGIRDAPAVGWGLVDVGARDFVGNHVVVRHAEGEFGLYAHLVPGSIRVAVGDRVERAAHLGDCGHSGHSSEPHLHFHLQDGPETHESLGLRIAFSNLRIDGVPHAESELRWGQRVCAEHDRPGAH